MASQDMAMDREAQPSLNGPYSPELFASQLTRAASRYIDPNSAVRAELIRKPDPITLYVGFLGTPWWRDMYARFLLARLQDSSYKVGRPLTQPEVDAYVDTHNTLVSNFRRGIPLGLSAGTAKFFFYEQNYKHLLAYAPSDRPEWQAMPAFRRYVEGTKMLVKMDTDMAKRLLGRWFFRLCTWTITGTFGLQFAAMFLMTSRLIADPRMQQHIADMKQQPPEQIRERRKQAVIERRTQQARELQQASENGAAQNQGNEQTEYANDSPSMGSVTASSTESAFPQAPSVTYTPYRPPNPPGDQDKGIGFFDDDDASPTAPEYRATVRRENTAAQGSAWERLRNQAQNPAASETASPAVGSWGRSDASAANNDGQRERERAQAEFNRMLDAERNQENESRADRSSSVWK
ncbi:hypothetical protein BJX64DRAFT_272968 [Aspergillus heterothallicus]